MERCRVDVPQLQLTLPQHRAACHLLDVKVDVGVKEGVTA
jgi:hypothetical protein